MCQLCPEQSNSYERSKKFLIHNLKYNVHILLFLITGLAGYSSCCVGRINTSWICNRETPDESESIKVTIAVLEM